MEGENSEIKDYKLNQVIKIISENHDRIQNSTTILGHGLKAVATQYTYWQNTAINSVLFFGTFYYACRRKCKREHLRLTLLTFPCARPNE